MTLYGRYGKAPNLRQMLRCHPADGSPPHKFAGRMLSRTGACDYCENPVAAHQGPRVVRRYDFPVVRAAEALVRVGQGVSYTDVADRLRARTDRRQFTGGAQLVANWVEVLGPVVASPHAETAWPETVVLDGTWFMVENTWTGRGSRAFAVLGVYGYPAGPERGRTWALKARSSATKRDWAAILRSLGGRPRMVISDDDPAQLGAVETVWPGVHVALCEHHLRTGALRTYRTYGLEHDEEMLALLRSAFRSPIGWRAFKAGVAGAGLSVEEWVERYDAQMVVQTERRARMPDHHSTGALERSLTEVRRFVGPRAYCYRNAERTNRMLELVRLRLNKVDDPNAYAAAIRAYLDANSGRLPRQGYIRDKRGHYSLR